MASTFFRMIFFRGTSDAQHPLQDVDAAMELMDERCVVTGAQGYASIER
jgi:hypothetical protein